MRAPALALVAALLVAGCVQPADVALTGGANVTDGNATSPPPAGGATPTSPPAPPSGENATSPPPSPNGTAPPPSRPIVWPSLDEAPVRPGVQVVAGASQCTSNFVFTSPDNASVYLGAAAHCFDGLELGDPVEIDGGTATGTLAYSSWITMGYAEDDGGAATCSAEPDETACAYNDFALVRVADADVGLVHPAMRHFGGPTGLVPAGGATMGDKVLTYGNSGLRFQVDTLSWHEGYVVADEDWTTTVATATPGVPGDSGSGVLLGDGRALGVLVTLTILPVPGTNGVTSLDLALRYAAEKGGVEARLATWELLDPGLLPG